MLGWFKKKFGKKDADEPQDPADLKIPVAPRPIPTQPQPPEEEDIVSQEEPVLPPEAQQPEPALDVTTVESPTALPVQDDEHDAFPAEEIIVEETVQEPEPVALEEEPETAELEEKPSPVIADVIEEVSEPELPLEEPEQDEVIEFTDTAIEETVEETDAVERTEPSETISIIEEEAVESLSPELDIEEEVIESSSPEPAIEDEVDEMDGSAIVENLEEDIDDLEDLSLLSETATEEEAVATPSPQEATAAALVAEKKSAQKKKSFLTRLAERLSRTRETFTYQLDTLFLGKKEIDAKLLDDLEELLITADLGLNVTQEVLDHARRKLKRKELSDPNSLKLALKEKLKSFILEYQEDATLVMPDEGPFVIMVVGVNGVGKTTTIGKIAHKFLRADQSVLLVAADTFRAAAVSQLKIWGERNNVQVISKEEGADPSAVVYDGIAHAKAKGYDVVLVDTAGRLHTQANLMEELKKIKRVMAKQLDGAPHEVMLVIDATTGQNGISQAKLFNEAVTLSGITLTKLDGTAKGGIVINICRELKLPIRFIGVGEQLDDLRDFDPDEFIEALFHSADATQQ
ncbi:signal recognition particle-docking protein FtsY [Desulfopila aestuarii]|uniref:Signal recognition particle receptor FtsY n=1 Tax=Desulfopila aestuarii DSM 18488 TaxID=1121416 RepID=A0A1M7Y3S5_9BACT|nr:signal recognition particle-docking protein FtsY [Desulfopila aestuarii]SHO46866.1 fused signal recognition particle receptor [Desulfopila aestuarii DSM 18488]